MKQNQNGLLVATYRFICSPLWFIVAIVYVAAFYGMYHDLNTTINDEKEFMKELRENDEAHYRDLTERFGSANRN